MSIHQKLKNSYRQGDFLEVIKLVDNHDFISQNKNEVEESLALLFDSFKKTEKKIPFKYYYEILEKVYEQGHHVAFDSALKSISLVSLKELEKYKVYELGWIEKLKRGELEAAKEYYLKASELLIKYKRNTALKELSQKALELQPANEVLITSFIRSHIYTGNIQSLYSFFELTPLKLVQKQKLHKEKYLTYIMNFYLELSEDKKNDLRKIEAFKEIYCWAYVVGLRKKESIVFNYDVRKTFVTFLFDLCVDKKEKGFFLLFLLSYAMTFHRKLMAQKIILYFEVSRNIKRSLKKIALSYQNTVSSMDDNEDEIKEIDADFDYGTDLFDEGSDRLKTFEEIKKLERDILFLQESGEKSEALKLLDRLREVDPENPLLSELIEEEQKKSGSMVLKRETVVENIERSLLAEIEKYNRPQSNDQKNQSRNMKKVISLMSEAEFQEQWQDLYVSMFQIEFYDVCLYVLERAKSYISENLQKKSDKNLIEIEYLKCEALFAKKEFHQTLDLCREVLQHRPLLRDEKNNFLYLAAESNLKLGNKKDAFSLFKTVEKTCPKFRLTRLRLYQIEKN